MADFLRRLGAALASLGVERADRLREQYHGPWVHLNDSARHYPLLSLLRTNAKGRFRIARHPPKCGPMARDIASSDSAASGPAVYQLCPVFVLKAALGEWQGCC